MKKISQDKLLSVKNQLRNGKSSREVASSLSIGKSTVNKIRESLKIQGPSKKAGRPKKVTERERREIIVQIKNGHAKSAAAAARDLKEEYGTSISADTARRILKEDGLKSYSKMKKPNLSAAHRRNRLKWAERHANWTVEDWKRVIWSDETKINRFGSDSNHRVWKYPGEGIKNHHVHKTVKFGGGSIMIWGCMSWAGPGKIFQVQGRMNGEDYCNILQENLLPTMDALSIIPGLPSKEEIIFQQDNDPKHTSKKAKTWFKDRKINLIDWPSQSPDLNPIEHLWTTLKSELYSENQPAKGVFELWQRTQQAWSKISKEDVQKLIQSMPNRCARVIASKGGYTEM